MSTTLQKRPLHQAMDDAVAFRNLIPKQYWHRWEIAGSLRRRAGTVGDVEHVVIPVMAEEPQTGLFADAAPTRNTLWDRVEELVKLGTFSQHTYETTRGPQVRWGPKYRGIDFRGFNHEIFIADVWNLGSVLAIRTGPWEFSRKLVSQLKQKKMVNRGGYVRNVLAWTCPTCRQTAAPDIYSPAVRGYMDAEGPGVECEKCKQAMEADIVDCPEESDFFFLAGMPLIPPERRT